MLKEDISCTGYLDFLRNNEVNKLDGGLIIHLTKAYYDALRYCSPKEKSEILKKIIDLNKDAVAYINTGYTILTDTAVVPNFITVDQLEEMKTAAENYTSSHNY